MRVEFANYRSFLRFLLPKLIARVRFPLPAPKSNHAGHGGILERAEQKRSGDSNLRQAKK
jgi:hypothetical protein